MEMIVSALISLNLRETNQTEEVIIFLEPESDLLVLGQTESEDNAFLVDWPAERSLSFARLDSPEKSKFKRFRDSEMIMKAKVDEQATDEASDYRAFAFKLPVRNILNTTIYLKTDRKLFSGTC